MSHATGSSRLFRLSLLLFPRWFRREYGREMLVSFEARHEELRAARGRVVAAAFALRSLAEAPAAALGVWLGWRSGPNAADGSLHGWSDDLRQASRSLMRSPGWTATALLILTAGLGGTTAVFSVLNAVLLRPLPYEDPDRLVSIWTVNQTQDLPDGSSYENGEDWLARSRGLDDLTYVLRPEFTTSTVTSFGTPERIHVGLVSANFFDVLGTPAVAGRVFGTDDVGADERVAVIGQALWTTRYAADPEVVGRTLTIDGEEVRIVGVVPGELAIPRRETQIWQLLDPRTPEGRNFRGFDAYWVIARLGARTTPAAAQHELDRIAADLATEYPETNRDRGVRVSSLRAEIVGDTLPLLLWTLFGSMALVLLVGGANVAQLMVSRGVERRREMAVRASLGASRARINRQLLLESALLSLCAGVGSLLLASAGLSGLVALIPPAVPLTDGVRIDAVVLLVGFAFAAVLAPLVGLVPALTASRADAATVLRAGGRGSTATEHRVRSLLVVAEVAMAVVLLAGSGLLVRSALELQAVDPGFDARQTLIAHVDLSRSDDWAARSEEILERVRAIPGARGAGAIEGFFIQRFPDMTLTIVGDTPREPGAPAPQLTSDWVLPGFFEALGVPLLAGRALEMADTEGDSPSVFLVNQSWVKTFADGRDPVGLQFRWGSRVEGDVKTVVGVVGDLRRTSLEEASYPQMFGPGNMGSFDVVVTGPDDPLAVAPDVRAVVRSVDPLAAVSLVSTVWDRYDVGLAPRHFQTLLFGIFAGLATLLAAVGLFAVLHEAVAARRREIGIRIALGAAPAGVRRLVFRSGVKHALAGLVIGLGATLALSGLLARFVYGIESTDVSTLALVSAALLAVSLLASFLPAVQATRVSPSETLAGD